MFRKKMENGIQKKNPKWAAQGAERKEESITFRSEHVSGTLIYFFL